jgi:hypothetical protein
VRELEQRVKMLERKRNTEHPELSVNARMIAEAYPEEQARLIILQITSGVVFSPTSSMEICMNNYPHGAVVRALRTLREMGWHIIDDLDADTVTISSPPTTAEANLSRKRLRQVAQPESESEWE